MKWRPHCPLEANHRTQKSDPHAAMQPYPKVGVNADGYKIVDIL